MIEILDTAVVLLRRHFIELIRIALLSLCSTLKFL